MTEQVIIRRTMTNMGNLDRPDGSVDVFYTYAGGWAADLAKAMILEEDTAAALVPDLAKIHPWDIVDTVALA